MRFLFMLLFQFRACSFFWRLNLKTQTFDLKWSLHLIFRRGSVHSTKMAYNRSWQNSRLNCCLELERIFYSISLNEKLVSNMNKFLFQNVICSVIIACTIWTLKSLKERVKSWRPFICYSSTATEHFFFERLLSILWILTLLSLTYKQREN